jgi:hypothetical protein
MVDAVSRVIVEIMAYHAFIEWKLLFWLASPDSREGVMRRK